MPEFVVLVDAHDQPIGTAEKLQAHLDARLHRAFSVFVFNSQGQMMLQQRAHHKYHSAGLWSNTCCSHPRPGEPVEGAAHRRLQEEMGFDCPVERLFGFTYKVALDRGLYEHEYDHVLAGIFDGTPAPNPEEVADWKWMQPADVLRDVERRPTQYTHWFKQVLQRTLAHPFTLPQPPAHGDESA